MCIATTQQDFRRGKGGHERHNCETIFYIALPSLMLTGLKGFGAVFGRKYMVHGTSWLEIKHIKAGSSGSWHRPARSFRYPSFQGSGLGGV